MVYQEFSEVRRFESLARFNHKRENRKQVTDKRFRKIQTHVILKHSSALGFIR